MLAIILWALLVALQIASEPVTVPIDNHWQGGFQGSACLPVTEEMTSWKVHFVFDQPINTLDVYTADVVSVSADKMEYVVGNKQWNAVEHVGDQLCIDFQGHGSGDISPNVVVYFDTDTGPHPHPTDHGNSGHGTTDHGQPTTTPMPVETPAGMGVAAPLTMTNDWGERFQGSFSFPLAEDALGWMVNISFSAPVIQMDIMNGQELSHSADGRNWVLVNKPERAEVPRGNFQVSFYGTKANAQDKLTGQAVFVNLGTDGNFTVTCPPKAAGAKYNYDCVLKMSIMFYEAQRSGKLPENNRIPWRGDSALNDTGDNGEDLTGGWYDAGDHIKFNFPMAYSSLVLTWGLLEFKDAYEASGQLEWMYECIKWPLDYLLKCHAADDKLYVQVGNGGPDHSYWGPPETMTMPRPAYYIDASKPGCDVAMETAAAFAAGYLAFKEKNSTYADELLQHARTLWQFATEHHGLYSSSVTEAAGFYRSYNYTDEMCWGSMWLYKATGEQKYLDEARRWFDREPDWGMSWDDKIVGCQILMYNLTRDQAAKEAVIGTFRDWFPGGSIVYTPKGLAWRLQWGSLRYASNMAMAALMAAESGINTEEYRHWAMCQIHYALGDTGFSYVIGYGNQGYPLRPHHRSSSCPSAPAPCGSSMMMSSAPNPHTLYGALVGGPDQSDAYTDARDNYVNNEVACDYNAGFQTAVAGLRSLLLRGEHPEQLDQGTCPYPSSRRK